LAAGSEALEAFELVDGFAELALDGLAGPVERVAFLRLAAACLSVVFNSCLS